MGLWGLATMGCLAVFTLLVEPVALTKRTVIDTTAKTMCKLREILTETFLKLQRSTFPTTLLRSNLPLGMHGYVTTIGHAHILDCMIMHNPC